RSRDYLGVDVAPGSVEPGSRLKETLESTLAALLGVEDTLVVPSISDAHALVLPTLVGGGTILSHDDPAALEALLREASSTPSVICLDAVDDLSGNVPDLRAYVRLARDYDTLLYVDDS